MSMKRVKQTARYGMRSPCFGFFLQGAVKSLAITDAGVQIGMIICISTGIVALILNAIENDWGEKDVFKKTVRFGSYGYFYMYHLVNIPYMKSLYLCADKRDQKRLQRWLTNSVMMFILYVVVFLMYTVLVKLSHPYGGAVFGGFIVFKLYAFWVLVCYILEVKYYGGFNSALRELSDEEIASFLDGHPAIQPDEREYSNVKHKPYKSDLEIPFTRLKLGPELGNGAFGRVLKAELFSVDGDPFAESQTMTVAVKTLNQDADLIYFKALLLELKILSYVGRHENVVNLIGACTSMLKERKIYIVVEFCKLGCITNYLRANRGTFVLNDPPLSGCQPPCLTDLIKWSIQTAAGMEYISSKNIIHSDLAGRNVLLSEGRVAKIADFGLSRQLYHYSTYIKQNDDPLPWRWMSQESLCDLKFSTASDVWSFAVTMWEYFTLGETPYPGYGFTTEFVKQLRSGQLRLYKPPYAADEIFTLMQKCWNSDPKMRPTFTELKIQLQEILLHCSTPQIVNSALPGYICV